MDSNICRHIQSIPIYDRHRLYHNAHTHNHSQCTLYSHHVRGIKISIEISKILRRWMPAGCLESLTLSSPSSTIPTWSSRFESAPCCPRRYSRSFNAVLYWDVTEWGFHFYPGKYRAFNIIHITTKNAKGPTGVGWSCNRKTNTKER